MNRWSRRDFAKALGLTASSSFFLPFAAQLRAQAAPGTIKRLILFYVPNGTQYEDWRPLTYGANFTPGKLFKPLQPHLADLIVLDKLKMKIESSPDNEHQRGLAALWTNAALNAGQGGSGFAKGISVDQVVANHLDKDAATRTALRSINMTIVQGDNNQAFQSFRDNNQPVVPIYNPYDAFKQLFDGVQAGGGGGGPVDPNVAIRAQQQQSVLDYLKKDIEDLSRDLSTSEKSKLADHLDGIRDLERRITVGQDPTPASCEPPTAPLNRPERRPPSEAQFQLMGQQYMDMIVEGFSCDRTRVATLMWDQPAGEGSFEFLKNVPRTDGYQLYKSADDNNYFHHDHSHQYIHKKDPNVQREARESLSIIHEWYMGRLAYLIGRLKERDLLDETLIVCGSDIATGVHTMDAVPFVLAGGANYFSTGKAINCTNMAGHGPLLTSICQAFGIAVTKFGTLDTTTGALPGIAKA